MPHHFNANLSPGIPQHSYGYGGNHVNMDDQRWTVFGQERGNTLLSHDAALRMIMGEDTSMPDIRERGNQMSKISQPPAQLTVFYAGTVSVYDNVPADKAHALMQLAGSGHGLPINEQTYPQYPPQDSLFRTAHSHHIETNAPLYGKYPDGSIQELTRLLIPCGALVPKALPIARKASLARFLMKRKERLIAPYRARDKWRTLKMYGLLEGQGENDGSNSGLGIENADDNSHNLISENSYQDSECGSAT